MAQTINLILHVVFQELENGWVLAEALHFPEVSRLGTSREQLRRGLEASALEILRRDPPALRQRRCGWPEPFVGEGQVRLNPIKWLQTWQKPIVVTWPWVGWAQGPETWVARVPALADPRPDLLMHPEARRPDRGLEVVARQREELTRLVGQGLAHTFSRSWGQWWLALTSWLTRAPRLELESRSIICTLLTRREQEQEEARAAAAQRAKSRVLPTVAEELTRQPLLPAYGQEELQLRLREWLTRTARESLLLVGPSGVGKTAAVRQFARTLAQTRPPRPLWATSGARLVAGMSGFGQWQARCLQIIQELHDQPGILYLGNLFELAEVGRGSHSDQGLASFFRPYLQRGEVTALAECTPEQLTLLERQEPQLLVAFRQLRVEPPTPEQGREILLQRAAALEQASAASEPKRRRQPRQQTSAPNRPVQIEPDALLALDRLHRRYASYSAYPGRPLRFLEQLVEERPPDGRITAAQVTALFGRQTGLPGFLLDETTPLDLPATEAWFQARLKGQPRAVRLTVDLLATIKAGLARPCRPLLSLLLIGPTGVGKTELARLLAEFLFSSVERLTRFDMSEYADPGSVLRLCGGLAEEGQLVARVREQPFSVLLFDELEKADPLFFDHLLPILGEGRLTDRQGRLADFGNTVILMTSNLGAELFGRAPSGFATGRADEATLGRLLAELRGFFRPELVNRLDRIVPFEPLTRDAVLEVARWQLGQIKHRDGLRQSGTELTLGPGVAEYLAARGFDPRYGARPLRRVVERELLAPLADGLNRARLTPLAAEARMVEGRLRVEVRPLPEARPREEQRRSDDTLARIGSLGELRRRIQAAEQSPILQDLRNRLFRCREAETWQARSARTGRPLPPEAQQQLAELPRLARLETELEALLVEVREREEAELLALHLHRPPPQTGGTDPAAAAPEPHWQQWLVRLYCLQYPDPDRVTLELLALSPAALRTGQLRELTVAYGQFGQRQGWQVACHPLSRVREGHEVRLALGPELPTPEPDQEPLAVGCLGFALQFQGTAARAYLTLEQGLHRFLPGGNPPESADCLVRAQAAIGPDYTPGPAPDQEGPRPPLRRTYDRSAGLIRDHWLGETWAGPPHRLGMHVADSLERSLTQACRRHVEQAERTTPADDGP